MNNPTILAATVIAADAEDAYRSVSRHMHKLDGVVTTGAVAVRSERHLLWDVNIAIEGPDVDVDDVWVVLTSYGITVDHLPYNPNCRY